MKDPFAPWILNRYPLVELRMTRRDCLAWMQSKGYPEPPRSACTFCPMHNSSEWRKIKDRDGADWRQVVEIDRLIRNGVRGTTRKLYLHRSLKPIDEVDFSTELEKDKATGQGHLPFMNECEGMCGV